MGYRSEVVFAVGKELAPFFTAHLAQNPEAERLCRDADQYESGYEEEGDFFMYWNHIKWYESYPEIKAIEEFIAELDEGAEEFFPGVDDERRQARKPAERQACDRASTIQNQRFEHGKVTGAPAAQ